MTNTQKIKCILVSLLTNMSLLRNRWTWFKLISFYSTSLNHTASDGNLPTVPICVHPKSLDRKVIYGSDHHTSSGSTVASFLSQDTLFEPWNKRPFAPLPNLDYVSVTTSEQDGGSHDDRDGPHRLEGDFRRLRVRDNNSSDEDED